MSSKGPELRLVDGEEKSVGTAADAVIWDKPAPTGPPTPLERNIPKHLAGVMKFFGEVIADEGILLDLCLDKATAMVEFNVKKRMFGSDLLQDNGQMHPFNLVAAASPLAIELYKNVLTSIGQRKDEYEAALKVAQEELKNGPGKAPSILLP